MTLIAPAYSTESPVNDLGTRYRHSLVSDEQTNIAQDAEKQLAVRTGGFSLNRLFVHRHLPLLRIAGGTENDLLKRPENTALALYLLVPAAFSCFIFSSVIYTCFQRGKYSGCTACFFFQRSKTFQPGNFPS